MGIYDRQIEIIDKQIAQKRLELEKLRNRKSELVRYRKREQQNQKTRG